MTDIDDELRGIIFDEAAHVRPPEDAQRRGWQRLAAAVAAGETGPTDTDPPPPRSPWPRLVPLTMLLVVGSLALLGTWRADSPTDAPATIAASDAAPPTPAPEVRIPFVRPDPTEAVGATPVPIAATGPRRTSTPRPPAAADEDSFAAELRLLAAAQAEIQRGERAAGLELLRRHARQYPAGHFAQDRQALQAIARCEDEQPTSRAVGERFLAAHPKSIHAERVRVACGL